MIIRVFSATISPGKRKEALDHWKRIAAYNKKHSEVEDSIVMTPLQGQYYRIMRSTRYSSLAALEEFMKKIWADPERQALAKEQQENQYHVPESLEWNMYQVSE